MREMGGVTYKSRVHVDIFGQLLHSVGAIHLEHSHLSRRKPELAFFFWFVLDVFDSSQLRGVHDERMSDEQRIGVKLSLFPKIA